MQRLVLVALTIGAIAAFSHGVWRWWRLVRMGRPDNRTENFLARLGLALLQAFSQAPIVRDKPLVGLFHALVFYGFFAFLPVTIAHYFRLLTNFSPFDLPLLRWYPIVADTFAVLILMSVIGFWVRRFLIRDLALYAPPEEAKVLRFPVLATRPHVESVLVLSFILLITIGYLGEMSLSIFGGMTTNVIAPLSSLLAMAFPSSLRPLAGSLALAFTWLHILTVLSFLAFLPHTKHTHIFAGFLNLVFKRLGSSGALEPLDLTEDRESFGARRATDLSWKRLFDAFACIECGRCTQVCPATKTLKPLDPKSLIENLRWHLLSQSGEILTEGKGSVPLVGEEPPAIINEEGVWACTTCGACYEACPFDIEHMLTLINLRQGLVLDEGKVPSSLALAYRGMENLGNPWNMGEERGRFARDLGVPTFTQKPDAEWLLWLGCAANYDDKARRVAVALIRLLQKAGVSFAILGAEETCTGDPARRTGNEYLFRLLAEQNIATLKRYKVRRIVTQCPHCFHVLKNEYSELAKHLGGEVQWEVWHHSQLLAELLSRGHLKARRGSQRITLHDPCYLARHNGIIGEPRKILSAIGEFVEIPIWNGRQTFCCGAGGGRMWMEERLGTPINRERARQALQTDTETIAVACPFCLTMLTDGVKAEKESVQVKDIAEVLWEAVADRR